MPMLFLICCILNKPIKCKVNVSLILSNLVKDLFLHLQCDLAVLTVCRPEDSAPHSAPALHRLRPGPPVRPQSSLGVNTDRGLVGDLVKYWLHTDERARWFTSNWVSHPSQSSPGQKTLPLTLPEPGDQGPQLDHSAGRVSVSTSGLRRLSLTITQQDPTIPGKTAPQLLTPQMYSDWHSLSSWQFPSP